MLKYYHALERPPSAVAEIDSTFCIQSVARHGDAKIALLFYAVLYEHQRTEQSHDLVIQYIGITRDRSKRVVGNLRGFMRAAMQAKRLEYTIDWWTRGPCINRQNQLRVAFRPFGLFELAGRF